jgi:hypothetical protein
MFSILKKRSRAQQLNNNFSLSDHIFMNPHNRWILNDKVITRALLSIINQLKPHQIKSLCLIKEIILLPISGEYSCLVNAPRDSNLILLFPNLIRILSSVDNLRGLAILAHEFGHIYYQHHQKGTDTLEAQIEADHFAYEAGYAHDLIEVLLNYGDIDSQTRVSVLTSKILSKQHS